MPMAASFPYRLVALAAVVAAGCLTSSFLSSRVLSTHHDRLRARRLLFQQLNAFMDPKTVEPRGEGGAGRDDFAAQRAEAQGPVPGYDGSAQQSNHDYDASPLAWQQQQQQQQQAASLRPDGSGAGGAEPGQVDQIGMAQQQRQGYDEADQRAQNEAAQQALAWQQQQMIAAAGAVGDGTDPAEVAADGAVTGEGPIDDAAPLDEALSPVPGSLLPALGNFKDAWDPHERSDIPMFWHIPKAGGSSIKDAMGGCHRFVQATEFGVTDGHDRDSEVAIVYPAVPGGADTDRSPFVNIDSTTVAGIQRAKSMGFADAQLADVVVSPFVFETNDLFTPTARGRLFSVFRHPIDRAVSMFYYIRVADWEPTYKPELKEWTLEEYARSDIVENNWMTRQLSNKLGGELFVDDLNVAMEVVRSKFLVGLMTRIEDTMSRFEKFFRWTYRVNPPNQEACRERLMSGGSNSNKANKEPLAEGDPAWGMLAAQNNFDLQLYGYIETLFDEQEAFVTGLPDVYRMVDATCCKCDPPTYPPEGFACPEAVKNAG